MSIGASSHNLGVEGPGQYGLEGELRSTVAPEREPAATQVFPTRQLVLLIALFWSLYGAIMTIVVLEVFRWNLDALPEVVLFCFAGAYVWGFLTLPLTRLVKAVQRARLHRGVQIVLLVTAGLSVALLVSVGFTAAATSFGGYLSSAGFVPLFRLRISRDALAAFLVLTAGVAQTYFESLQLRQQEAAELRARLVESRLESLRAQLNPHFLFNTLNAIAALATIDPQRVQRSLAQLSDLLRYMLVGSVDQEVTVETEFSLLRRYFEIVELRYEEWLKTTVTGEADALKALVPNLILQPLAENALKHGVARAGKGRIDVQAVRAGDTLVLTVADSGSGGVPAPKAEPPGTGFGLRHTKERLEQLYPGNYGFVLTPVGGGTVAEIRIPYHTDPLPGPLSPR
jgi:two-component system, LytTR family, sensor kinase